MFWTIVILICLMWILAGLGGGSRRPPGPPTLPPRSHYGKSD